MAGSQFGLNYNNVSQIDSLFDIVKIRIASTFDVYNMTNDDIVYIQLTFRKLDIKLLADFTLDKNSIVNDNITDREINTIISTTNIPMSTDESSLGTALRVTLFVGITKFAFTYTQKA